MMDLFFQAHTPEDRMELVEDAPKDEIEFFEAVNKEIESRLKSAEEAVVSYTGRLQKLVDELCQRLPNYDSIEKKLKFLIEGFIMLIL